MELAENVVETLVGILWWIVKYLQHKYQFIWKQMYKWLASFPVSGIKNVPSLRAAILLTFEKNWLQEKRVGVRTEATVLKTGTVLGEFILM